MAPIGRYLDFFIFLNKIFFNFCPLKFLELELLEMSVYSGKTP